VDNTLVLDFFGGVRNVELSPDVLQFDDDDEEEQGEELGDSLVTGHASRHKQTCA